MTKKMLNLVGALAAIFALGSLGYSQNIWELRDKTNAITCIVNSSGELDTCPLDAADLNRGTIPNARLDSTSVTLQGNTFNGASQLVQLNGSTQLPAVDGSQLTNVTASQLAANGANCSAGFFPLGVDALGAAESCTDAATQAELDSHTGDTSAHSATSANTPSRIVLRDANGDFEAGIVTATVAGNATTATALAANGANCSAGNAPLGVDASGASEGCFDVATQSELSTHEGLTGSSAHGATSANTASQIVTRDASGNFSAGAVTMNSAIVDGLTIDRMTAAELRAAACAGGAAACLSMNTTDWDLYSSTGSSTGQWRNTRTGVGP